MTWRAAELSGPVLDVGCGTGHIAFDITSRGLEVIGIDPSTAMLDLAKQRYPGIRWLSGDASLRNLPDDFPPLAGIIARFSLIHATHKPFRASSPRGRAACASGPG